MLCASLLLSAFTAFPQDPPRPEASPLAPARARLRAVAGELAKAGDAAGVACLRKVLADLGEPAKDLERLAAGWDKTVAKAKPTERDRAALPDKVRREVAPLAALLPSLEEKRRGDLARSILELDSDEPKANAALGRVQGPRGAWLTQDALAWENAAAASEAAHTAASRLEVVVTRGPATSPVAKALGGTWSTVRAHGLEIESPFAPDVLERILRQALRAIAFSNALLHGTCEVPKKLSPHKWVLPDSDANYPAAVEEAFAHEGITKQSHDEQVQRSMRSFGDSRGWRTSRFRPEADYEALILWDCIHDLIGASAQPCLRVGHVNWVCLAFLGTSMPMSTWADKDARGGARTLSQRDEERQREALWRAARQGTYGCRAWMIRQVKDRHDPSWESTMLDQDGKIEGAALLKATLVCEHLQQDGALWRLIEGSRQPQPPAATLERVLGRKLEEVEARWRAWLLPETTVGLVQRLERKAMAGARATDPAELALAALQRARGLAIQDPPPEIGAVALEPELSQAAAMHARYLVLHPEQQTAWPAAHEEYPDQQGFSPKGAQAGLRSVIHFHQKPAQAIEGWLGTFYHRLPLLDPGLFGLGYAESDGVIVMDVGSLVAKPLLDYVVVWPVPDATNVPLRFHPEIPNPVPGQDQGTLGYPITVQLSFREAKGATHLTMEVSADAGKPGAPLAGHFLSPEAPLFANLAPANAWCFIPAAPLEKKTRYKVSATWTGGSKSWCFTTGE